MTKTLGQIAHDAGNFQRQWHHMGADQQADWERIARAVLKANQVVTKPDSLPDRGNTTCNPHPDAPHGFSRNASHSAGRYVCDCEGWVPDVRPQNCGTNHCSCIECPYPKTDWSAA